MLVENFFNDRQKATPVEIAQPRLQQQRQRFRVDGERERLLSDAVL